MIMPFEKFLDEKMKNVRPSSGSFFSTLASALVLAQYETAKKLYREYLAEKARKNDTSQKQS
jgi:hypothetical protein